MNELFSIPLTRIDGTQTTLADYRGKVLLIVNTASRCGFTPQYAGLETLYQKYKDRGFAVLGFPCNQFGAQEPGDESQIAAFCEKNYGVSFPLFSKVEVNGPGAHPLFIALRKQAKGLLGSEAIKWNFTKFLVGRDGTVFGRYSAFTLPPDLESKILALIRT